MESPDSRVAPSPPRRGPSSARLFLYATLAFVLTAGSLFLELPSREGLLGRIGWGGIVIAGPVAVVLVILALRRYSQEVAAEAGPPLAQEEPPSDVAPGKDRDAWPSLLASAPDL